MKIFILAILLFSSLIQLSCKKDNPIPPGEQPQLNLSLEDVSCTEAWINLKTTNLSLPAEVEILKDSILTKTITLISADTVLYIDSLLPNKTYIFSSIIQSTNHPIKSSAFPVVTMDTTSHNFTWQTFTFGGQAGSCSLRDVAVISIDNIWAVGEIFVQDTLGQPLFYNAVHWDGKQWELKRFFFPSVCGSSKLTAYRASSIFAFQDGQIWVSSSGDKIAISKDDSQINQFCLPWSFPIGKIWGISSNDLYVIGVNGNIAYYQNGHWSKIESGTTMSLVDIIGISGDNVFISGYDPNQVFGMIMKKNNFVFKPFAHSRIVTPQELFNPDLYGYVNTIWFDEKSTLYAAGNFLYQYRFGNWDYIRSLPENYMEGDPLQYRGYISDVKGIKSNDMWIAGDRNTLRHFNGASWKQIGFPYSPDSDIGWWTVYPTENCTAVVGDKGNSAIVMLITK